ncbi:MAG: DsbA family oxidoreductase [Azospirillum sp.]|nr:DsbA family oxidoreductase [Azospirillum sp.]
MFIEVFSDLVCPWCYIGAKRLEQALAMRPQVKTERRWVPFQLNPDLPPGGIDRSLYLAIKFGGRDRARRIYAIIEEAAAIDRLPLALDRIRTVPNTLDAHRLIALAERRGRGEALTNALFAAYFAAGDDIGDRDLLCLLAARVGLDSDEARQFLAGTADAGELAAAEALIRELDLHSVPFYRFDRCYALAGAQEPLVFLPLIELAVSDAPALV